MRRVSVIASVACVVATMVCPPAQAGTYHVLACSNMGSTSAPIPNNAWTQVPAPAPTGLEALVSCPPQGSDQHDGIAAEDDIPGPPDPAPGAEVYWRFA